MEQIKLQFGSYELAELCHLLWMDVTVRTVDSAPAKQNESNCNLDAMSKLNCVICYGLWVDVTVPIIVRFVPEGEFT